jgi:hypothetical protein
MMGQRGSGKSHIMALVHHAFGAPDQVESWAAAWGEKIQAPKLIGLKLQRGFMPLSETLLRWYLIGARLGMARRLLEQRLRL